MQFISKLRHQRFKKIPEKGKNRLQRKISVIKSTTKGFRMLEKHDVTLKIITPISSF